MLLPGMYIADTTVLHRLDPRTKTVAATILMILPFVASSLASNLILSAFVACITLLAAVPLLALLRTLRAVFWTGLILFFFYAFTVPGESLLTFAGVSITWAGLMAGGIQIYRLCLLVIISSLLTYTTSPTQLAHGLEAAFGPLARVGVPVRELAMVLTIALRFVPTLSGEIDKIDKAQRARGVDPGNNPVRRVQSWVPMFVPIFVSAFRRAEQLATAMEARGFRGTAHRTQLHELRLERRDLVAALVVAAASLAILGAAYV